MKTERRHELQTNELAIWLAGWVGKIKPYGKLILGGIILLLAVWVATAFIWNRGQKEREQAWSSFFQVYEGADVDADQLTQMATAQSYGETEAGLWALQTAADLRLGRGAQQLFVDRTQAIEDLEKAEETYRSVTEKAQDPLLKQRAMFGLAQTLESRNNFEDAKKQYQQVVQTWPDSAVGHLAQQRIDNLQQPATQDWYAWFAEQKPVVSPLSDPSLFEDLPNLPESPNLSVPEPGQLIKPSEPAPAEEGPPGGLLPEGLNTEQSALPLDLDGPGASNVEEATPDLGNANPSEIDVEPPSTDPASESASESPTP
jgi:tetratricopeptide (TPR) repeat protein